MDFLNDGDKMLDFFNMKRDEFLNSYDYLTEDDYTETVKAIFEKLKFNDYKYYHYETCEGIDISKIVMATMMYKWLND